MTHYMDELNATVIFEEKNIDYPLARVISEAGLYSTSRRRNRKVRTCHISS